MAWYSRRGDTEGGIKKAEETISWCENNGFYGYAVDLLGVAKGWAEESRNYELLGETEDRIGENKGQVGEWENAKVSFLAAGRAYLKVGLLDSALKSFEKGEEAIKSEMRLSAVGLYCIKDVALESLVPEYNGLSERWKYMKNAVGWINKATDYLVDDYGKSVKQVENYIRQCEHALKGPPMERQSEIRRKCGWAYYCLAELHLKVGKDRVREEALGKAKEHLGNELESFLKR